MKSDRKQKQYMGNCFVFTVYILMLAYFLLFAEMLGRTNMEEQYHYNLTLFREIRRFWVYREILGTKAMCLNLAGNIVAFMPFGYFLPLLKPRTRNFLFISLCGFLLSFSIEVTQLIFRVGIFDVDDLLLNTIGGLLGYLVYRLMACFTPRNEGRG